jgi:hypothetical protein
MGLTISPDDPVALLDWLEVERAHIAGRWAA